MKTFSSQTEKAKEEEKKLSTEKSTKSIISEK